MNGDQLRGLIRKLTDGDNNAQRLAWQLDRADGPKQLALLDEHADLVEEHSAKDSEEDTHPTLNIQ